MRDRLAWEEQSRAEQSVCARKEGEGGGEG